VAKFFQGEFMSRKLDLIGKKFGGLIVRES
jgi:hypothetical protein